MKRAEIRDALGAVGPDERRALGGWLTRCGWTLDARTLRWSSALLAIRDVELLRAVRLQAAVEDACGATLHDAPRC